MMNNVRKYLLFSAAALGAVLFFALNFITPLYMDDYSYMLDFVTKERIDSLSDIIRSMGIHYMKVNGRYVTHFLAQVLLAFGKGIFDLLNTAVFALLVYLMHTLSGGRGKLTLLLVTVGVVGLWFCSPDFGQSFLWVTGACNYLWGVVLMLSLVFILRYPELLPSLPGWSSCILLFVLGLLAGNTTENAFAALTVAAVGLIAFHKMNGKRLPLEMFFGLAGAFCGGVAMVFSPGELARLSSSGQGFEASVIFERCLDIARRYLSAYWTILAVIALLLCVGLFSKTLKRDEAVLFAVYFVSSRPRHPTGLGAVLRCLRFCRFKACFGEF